MMEELKAFVGHSFSAQDKAVVMTFLGYFDKLSKLYPTFSWDHAEEAEPLPLSEKVMAKVEGKNVFIGICTRSERALPGAALRRVLGTNLLVANGRDAEWKVSDWIIQEVGLAVGRRMSIILLLEEGVRRPGGLQGDVEYISFDRDHPQGSFEKFVDMLVALKPKSTTSSSGVASAAPVESKSNADEDISGDAWEPKLDWPEEKFSSALWRKAVDNDEAAFNGINEAFKQSKYFEGITGAEWEGKVEWIRSWRFGKSDFGRLKKLADANPTSSILRLYVARQYIDLNEHENAAKALIAASGASTEDEMKVAYEAEAAVEYARAGKIDLATEIFEGLKAHALDSDGLANHLAVELRNFAQLEKDDEFELAVLERIVELSPADVRMRFQLAYKHSNYENDDMAFHHYTSIPTSSRDSMTWNNLGVFFGSSQMPVKSIDAFKRAESEGNTLAMSNIGSNLLRAGFVEEAQERATKAMQIENYHQNITDLLKRLRSVREEEDQKANEALDKVRPKASFYRLLGKAAFAPAPTDIGSKWQARECVLEVTVAGSNVRMSGSYEQDANPFAFGILGSTPKKEQRRINYTLRLRGKMLVGDVKRTTVGESPSVTGLGVDAIRVAMYLGDDFKVLFVMEGYSGGAGRFYELKRLD